MKKEKRFNKVLSTVIMAGMLMSIAIATAFKLQDPGVNRVMLLVAGFGSLMGVMSTVLSANALIWTFLFGILDVVLDSVVALDAGAPGNFALHAFYFLNMAVAEEGGVLERGGQGPETEAGAVGLGCTRRNRRNGRLLRHPPARGEVPPVVRGG